MSAQKKREEEHKSHDHLESPGKRLRIARQAKGLTQQDIAAQLHLSSSIIQALEEDDHDRLPGPVFVRGYLRNYARILDLEDKAVLNEFDGTPGDTGGVPLTVASGVKPEIRSSHFGIRLMTWLIVIVLIGLLGAWWQGRLEWPAGGLLPESTTAPATPVVDDQGTLLLPEPEPEQETAAEMPEPVPAEADSTGSYTPPAEPEPHEEATVVETVELSPVQLLEPAMNMGQSAAEVTAREPVPGEPIVEPAAEPETAVAGADTQAQGALATVTEGPQTAAVDVTENKVVFEFVGSCWVDIRDSTRTFKLFGEMHKGERHELGGTPPYSVILGNSPMVRVNVGGAPYDVEAHSRGNVARFTLDPSAAQ